MRTVIIAFLLTFAALSGGSTLIAPVLAQSGEDKGGDDAGDGRGSGCDHSRQEDTIS